MPVNDILFSVVDFVSVILLAACVVPVFRCQRMQVRLGRKEMGKTKNVLGKEGRKRTRMNMK